MFDHSLTMVAQFLAVTAVVASVADKPPITAQAERGRELFQHSTRSAPCATCHHMDGIGNEVGPDLTRLATFATPPGIAMSIQMSMTAYVQEVETNKASFPGIQKSKQADTIEIWDLSKHPPELRTLKSEDVISMHQNQSWKHPPLISSLS